MRESGFFTDIAKIALLGFNGLENNKFDTNFSNSVIQDLQYKIKDEFFGKPVPRSRMFKLVTNDRFYSENAYFSMTHEEFYKLGEGLDIDRIMIKDKNDLGNLLKNSNYQDPKDPKKTKFIQDVQDPEDNNRENHKEEKSTSIKKISQTSLKTKKKKETFEERVIFLINYKEKKSCRY